MRWKPFRFSLYCREALAWGVSAGVTVVLVILATAGFSAAATKILGAKPALNIELAPGQQGDAPEKKLPHSNQSERAKIIYFGVWFFGAMVAFQLNTI